MKSRKSRKHLNSLSSKIKQSGEVACVNTLNPTTPLGGGSEPVLHNNRLLLAGYMAYEFLTAGTLLGQKFNPARSTAEPAQSAGAQSRKVKRSQKDRVEAEPNDGEPKMLPSQSYAEVTSLLERDGTHIPGIVNPTELVRWFQM